MCYGGCDCSRCNPPDEEPVHSVNEPDIRTSEEFKKWWFGLPINVRKTLNIRSCVIGWNANLIK